MADQVFDIGMLDDAGRATKQAESFGEKLSFGKWTFTGATYQRYDKDAGAFNPISQAEYRANPAGVNVKYQVNVDVQELNPALTFTYDRTLDVGSADWFKTFLPSLAECFGKDGVYNEKGKVDEAKLSEALRSLHGKYVQVSDVPQQPKKGDKHLNKTTGLPYNTTKLIAVYADKAACVEAHDKRFAKKDASNGNGTGSVDPFALVRGDVDFIGALKASVQGKPKPKQDAALVETIKEWTELGDDAAKVHLAEAKQLAGL